MLSENGAKTQIEGLHSPEPVSYSLKNFQIRQVGIVETGCIKKNNLATVLIDTSDGLYILSA